MFGDPTLLTSEHSKTAGPRQPASAPTAPALQPGTHQGPGAAGFVALPNAILIDTSLSCVARLLYAVLLFHARQDGRCFPALATLCRELGLGETTVRQYLRELRAAGLISQQRRGQGHTNLYILHAAALGGGLPPGATLESEPQLAAPCPVCVLADPADIAGQEPHSGAANEERDDLDPRFVTSKLRIVPAEPATTTDRAVPQRDIASQRAANDARGAAAAPGRATDDHRYQALIRPLMALTAELGDVAPVRSNVTRAYHLLLRSGLSYEAFLQLVAEARALTLASRGRITRRCVGGDNVIRTNMMPYFFSVLASLVERRPARQQGDASPEEYHSASRHPAPHTAAGSLPVQAGVPVEREGNSRLSDPHQDRTTPGEMDHQILWDRLLAGLRRMLAPAAYAHCLGGVVRSTHGVVVRIEARDPAQLCWFETRLRRAIEAALADLGQVGLRVVFSLP